MQRQQTGFTLIELLVVIAIIGMLATLSVVSLQSACAKARDAVRVSSMQNIRTALELYFNDQQMYPNATSLTLGAGSGACLGQAGFDTLGCGSPIMAVAPTNPTPNGTPFVYTGGSDTYSISFSLEGQSGELGAGGHTLTPQGYQ